MTEINFTLDTISEAASQFIKLTGDNKVFLFEGDMGAGKTTFIAEVCRLLGADDDFGSPTFSLVNEYADLEGNPIYHFDLYRINTPKEAFDMGAIDYLYSGSLCLVEWPDRLGDLTPEDAVKVAIRENEDGSRTLLF